MSPKKNFNSMEEAKRILGEEFWDVLTDVLPYMGPRIDICKFEKNLLIVAELPGIQSPKDVMIYLDGNSLVLEGKITRDYGETEALFIKNERYQGPFKRKIRLPQECIISQLQAEYQKGLLKINIPLSNESIFSRQEIPIVFNEGSLKDVDDHNG